MNTLIIFHVSKKENSINSLVQQLSTNSTVEVVNDFDDVLRLVRKGDFGLLTIMTMKDSFPRSWRMHEIQIDCPTVIIQGAKDLYLLALLNTFSSLELDPKGVVPLGSEKPAGSSLFYKSLTYIEKNLCDNNLSLGQVAEHIFVSRCHYSRMFKSYLGTGFKDYVMSKRIQEAKKLLRHGFQVTDVCYAVGYNDLTHFGRIFKRLEGVNPSKYRLQFQKNKVKE